MIESGQHVQANQRQHPGARVPISFGSSNPNITIGMPSHEALIQPRIGATTSKI